MNIQPTDVRGSHRTGGLSGITAQEITALLGFEPNVEDDPDKVVHSWAALVDGDEIAIWDYYGSHKFDQFSTYGSGVALAAVFGDRYSAG